MIDCSNFCTPAVIPSALGPLQALLAILPHLLAIFGAALVAITKPNTYRALIRYFWTHKILALACLSPFALFFWRGSLFGAKVVAEKTGSAWIGFRGGAERTGSVSGARGAFDNPRILWNEAKSSTGRIQAIDSSPSVVGNRVYFGTSIQTPLTKSGSITCLDTETGATAWQYTGAGMDRALDPIFSSPAIGGDDARYLVCGEGYHVEQNSRIVCLDLARVRSSGGKEPPEFKWAVPTTNHVECSPAIFENKVYIGAGDDGWWCIDLLTGKVKWRLEGNPYYVIKDGPQVEALAKLAGKTVAVDGSPTRFRPDKDKDFSIMFLDATAFTEVQPGTTLVPNPAMQDSSGKALRTVIGKIVLTDASNHPDQKGSRVKIEMEKVYADAECDPIALRIDGQPRLICGCGLDGKAVLCIDAETGKELWRTPTTDPVFSAPAYADGRIIVGLSNGTFAGSAAVPSGSVVALSAADGHILWEHKTADGVLGSVAIKDGRAYACSLDGRLHVLNAIDGKLTGTFNLGSKISSSPTVTDSGVFMATASGKMFCLKRDTLTFNWSLNITPNKAILSSPCAAENRIFIGSAESGLFCLGEGSGESATRKSAAPWSGPGGNPAHSHVADEHGPPSVDGNKAERRPDIGTFASQAVAGPIAACGNALYFPTRTEDGKYMLACIDTQKRSDIWQCVIGGALRAIVASETHVVVLADEKDGTRLIQIDPKNGARLMSGRDFPAVDQPFLSFLGDCVIAKRSNTALIIIDLKNPANEWHMDGEEIAGTPALKHGLMILAVASPVPHLVCVDDSSRTMLWITALTSKPLCGPSISGDKVFVAITGKNGTGSTILCRCLTDGHTIWESTLDKIPVSPLALSSDHLAFTADDGTVIVLETRTGDQSHTIPLGKGGQAPAIHQQTLFLCASGRIGAYDLATSSWLWGYRDQKQIGAALTAPILANEAVWISTEKQGLITIGGKDATK